MKPEEILVESTGVIGQRIKKVNAEQHIGLYIPSVSLLGVFAFFDLD